jgi:hypothetical protein
MRRLAKFRALPAERKRLLVLALIALPLCSAALKITSLRRLQAVLSRFSGVGLLHIHATSGGDSDRIRSAAWAVRAAADHGLVRGQCLQQSVSLWWLLRCQNLKCDVRFGARRGDDKLEAHAWVEAEGLATPLDPYQDASFVPLVYAGIRSDAGCR